MDKILSTPLREVMQSCEKCFRIRNRTIDGHTFLSRIHNNKESLQLFWNNLNGLVAKCDFGDRTEGLVHDIFILNMSNKHAQKTMHGSREHAGRGSRVRESILGNQTPKNLRSSGGGNQSEERARVHDQQRHTRVLEMWNMKFTAVHISQCKGPFRICNYCGIKRHMEVCCNQKKDNRQNGSRNYGNTKQFGNRNRFANRAQLVDQDEELEDDVMVMKIDGDYGDEDSTHPYYMEGFINGYPFKTMI